MTRGPLSLFFASFFVLCVVLLRPNPASACGNAVLATSEAVATLTEAEEALANGDVVRAYNLAWKLRVSEDLAPPLEQRAVRIMTLATIRDRDARPEAIKFAASDLERLAAERKRNLELPSDPALEADYGEALEAAGRMDEAFLVLAPLAEKDLIGSAYAYGALSRAARQRGDEATANSAYSRCLSIARSPDPCNRVYPRASLPYRLVRGTTAGYLVPAFVFFATIGVARRLARRKKEGPFGAAFVAARAFVARSPRRYALAFVIVLLGGLAFFAAKYTILSTLIALGASAIAIPFLLGMKAFLRAVSRGDARTKAFTLREPTPEDASLPEVKFFFGEGPATLESSLEDASYREGARTPVLRVTRRPAKMLVAIAVFGMLALFVSFALFGLTLTMRSAKASEPPTLSL